MCVGRAINDRFYLRVQGKNTAFRHVACMISRSRFLLFLSFFFFHRGKKNSWHIQVLASTLYVTAFFSFYVLFAVLSPSLFTLRTITCRTETHLKVTAHLEGIELAIARRSHIKFFGTQHTFQRCTLRYC